MKNTDKRIAIMQPYLFPYIGYFQLINAVDYFGIGDDVQYIKGGWINKNRILLKDKVSTFTFPVKKDSYYKKINEREFHKDFNAEKEKFLRILKMYYKKAPFFHKTFELVEEIISSNESNVSLFLQNQLKIICNYLNINTELVDSKVWEIEVNSKLKVEERAVIKLKKISNSLNVNHFINPIGGSHLYDKQFFNKHDFKLSFLKSDLIQYKQFSEEFEPNLSIIDVMMFNDIKSIKTMLNNYNLV